MDVEGTAGVQLRSDEVAWRELGGELFVLDLVSSEYLTVNGSGTLLWQHLVEGTTSQALIRCLVDTYGIDESQAGADVAAFISECQRLGLLQPTATTS